MGESNKSLFIVMWVITVLPMLQDGKKSWGWVAYGYLVVHSGYPLHNTILLRFQKVADFA
ncbi:Uncharacterised protein [Yersinia pseudotuberculosis]|uniref:Uncharacterized protein n=1 Tax=Yersinia pseudotuberculosis serotype O:3 (strain YPIII) TaxID=502800 RepID=A0A0H3B5E9_YERPY|nr:hypothetical protein BZ22_3632 [Yersinia pseudotuberculosis YPIII]SQA50327.1 Uncharacterised protein [Yersinia pseudotuberculosis]